MIANLQPTFHLEIGVKATELILPVQPVVMEPHPSYMKSSIPSWPLKKSIFYNTSCCSSFCFAAFSARIFSMATWTSASHGKGSSYAES
jgi:hypothetical protein